MAMSLLGLSVNAGLSIPMLGVAEQFFTSTIYKVEGGCPGLFLTLLNLFILPALLLSRAYRCFAHCWGSFACARFLRWLMSEELRGLLAMLRLVVLAMKVTVPRKGLSLRELVTRVCLVMVAMLGQKVLARLPSTSDPRP
jgi:hypothetical protein